MSSPNFVLLEGFVARNAELRELKGGLTVLSFSLAVSNGRNKDGESLGSSYFDVEFWNPSEKVADNILDASEDEDGGLKVAVRGRLKQDRWENDEGETRSRVKISATTVSVPNYSENGNNNDDGGSRRRGKKNSKRSSGRGGKKSSSRRNSGGNSKKRSSRRTAEEDTGRSDDDDFGDDEDDDDGVPF